MPPPPPPRLPPPPDAPPEPKPFKPSKGSCDKNDVFKEINKGGFKLKKTVTVDKSGPYIPGKVNNINNNNNNNNTNKGFRLPSTNTSTNQSTPSANGVLNFGDLFSGGMPTLKPTGLRPTTGKFSPNGAISTETSNKSKETINNLLKKQVAARGPPPQPPSTSLPFASTSKNIVNEDKPLVNRLNSHNKISSDLVNKDNVDSTIKTRSTNLLANSSSLHGNNTNSDNNNVSSASGSVVNQRTKLINHGKPNLAPKPPGVKPSPPPKSNIINGRLVNRTQSMRMSRSPPITPTSPFSSTSPFGNGNDFNSLRNVSTLHQSHETLNRRNQPVTPTRNATLPGRPTQPPPSRPPQAKPPPPPRTGSNTCIIPPQSPPPPPPPSLSRVAPPPPPAHSRVAPPPPPPPVHARPNIAINNCGPPEPPQRGSSMRNGVQISAASAIQEFDSRYIFHSVTDFPLPDTFKRINKQYSGAGSKQQAPLPPNTHIQLGTKLWSGGDSSNC